MTNQRIIAVDVGNSAVKIGWQSGASDYEVPVAAFSRQSFALRDPQWDMRLASDLVDGDFVELSNPVTTGRCWLVASVNRPAMERMRRTVAARFPQDSWLEITRDDIEIEALIRNPETIGIDRLLGAYGALALSGGGPVVSIDAGSAITVDLANDGRFHGGAILPGVHLQFSVLCQGTDRLPSVSEGHFEPLEVPGRDTVSAMRCGVLHGIAGAIDRLVQLYSSQLNDPPMVVLTGGDGSMLASLVQTQVVCVRDLVLSAIFDVGRSAILRRNPIPKIAAKASIS